MKLNLRLKTTGNQLTLILKKTLLFCFFISLPFLSVANESKKGVTLNLSNVSLVTFFHALEKESGYIFFFNKSIIDPNVRINVKVTNEPVVKVLDKILPQQNLTYTIKGRQIIVAKKSRTTAQSTPIQPEPNRYIVSGRFVD